MKYSWDGFIKVAGSGIRVDIHSGMIEKNIGQSSHAAVPLKSLIKKSFQRGNVFGCFLVMYVIQHCFICRPSDFTVSEDAGIEPRIVVTLALTARHSNHLDRSQSQKKN
jgi:hypothetical protein